jgi:hypothetical protein
MHQGVLMTQIVAAEFDDFAAADAAVDALRGQGFPPSHLTKFFLNAPGQHAQYPVGGDTLADPGSEGAAPAAVKGAVVGSATGLALGIAAASIAGPAAAVAAAAGGAAAGAYTGSLVGAAQELGGSDKDKPKEDAKGKVRAEAPTSRPAGVVVAVNVPTPDERERATSIFWRHRANSIELAEGTWNNGTWQDFNPQSLPHWRKAPAP